MTTGQTSWIVDGLIALGHTHVILGRPGRGKSWVVDSLAVSVASNSKVWRQFPSRQCPVILIDEDTPTPTIGTRIQRLHAGLAVALQQLPLEVRSMQGFSLDNRADVDALINDIQAKKGPVLVILDCLDTVTGDWDSNKTPDAKKIVKAWNEIIRAGATLMVVHHMSLKGKNDREIWDSDIDFTKLGMGNSKLIAGCDVALGVWYLDGATPTTFVMKKRERRVLLDVPELFAVQLLDTRGSPSALLFYRDDVPRLPSEDAKLIFCLFFQNPSTSFTVKEVKSNTGEILTDKRTRDALTELASNGVLDLGRDRHNLYRYSLSPNFQTLNTDYANALRP